MLLSCLPALSATHISPMLYLYTLILSQASGLADGKGVLLPTSTTEAVAALHLLLNTEVFGGAGKEVVVEQYIEGEEVSVLAFCDGVTAVGMPPAQVGIAYHCTVHNILYILPACPCRVWQLRLPKAKQVWYQNLLTCSQNGLASHNTHYPPAGPQALVGRGPGAQHRGNGGLCSHPAHHAQAVRRVHAHRAGKRCFVVGS